MLDAVIGLGANLGDRAGSLVGAVRLLREHARIVAVSPLYLSRPVGGPAQPDFYNAGVRLEFAGEPGQLMRALLDIEQEYGRQRDTRWGPRTLDLDLLWISGRCVASAELTVPHPRLTERAFALVPLISLIPTARDPRSGEPYTAALRCVGVSGLTPVSDANWDALRGQL